MATTKKKLTGPEVIDEMIKKPTLDQFFDRNLKDRPLTDEELNSMIEHYRQERALINGDFEPASAEMPEEDV